MRRILPVVFIFALLLSGTAAVMATPAGQEGLPPELTIADKPSYETQLRALQALDTAAAQLKPRGGGGGLFSGLRSMFGGGGAAARVLPITPEALVLGSDKLKGQQVAVSGVYKATGKESAVLPYESGNLNLSVPAGVQLIGFDSAGPNGLPVSVEGIVETAGSAPQVRAAVIRPDPVLLMLRMARLQELLKNWQGAETSYEEAFKRASGARSPYAAFAKVSAARVAYNELGNYKKARGQFSSAWNPFTGVDKSGRPLHYVWYPSEDDSRWEKEGVAAAIKGPLDTLNKRDFWYRFMDFFVLLAGGQRWLGIIFLAIISRVIIWPLTKKQLDSAEAMKRLQPQIKALQDRYVDDKAKFQTEFWALCQQNGVNPLGGCLPMLVQMPVLIFLWNGIRAYIVQFNGHSFLWVKNLAAPDIYLLVAYTISMIFFQKMTQKLQPAPTMNPQQAQQQQMMTYMMPLMFFFFFQTFPAAFLLYWLATNVVYFAQQWMYQRSVNKKIAEGGVESLIPGKPKTGGFAGAMAKMMSMKAEEGETATPESKSFHEKEAESRGKKTSKPAEKPGGGKRK